MASNSTKLTLSAVAVVGIGAAAWVGTSQFMANRTEAELRAYAARTAADTNIRILDLKHSTGFLKSSGTFTVQPRLIDPDIDPKDIPTAEVAYTMSHLLLPTSLARHTWTVTPIGALGEEISTALGRPLTISGAGTVSYSGTADSAFSVPEIALKENDSAISIAASTGSLSVGSKTLGFDWSIDTLTLTDYDATVALKSLALAVDVTDRALGLGTTKLSLDSLSTPDGNAEGLSHTTTVTLNGDRLDIRNAERARKVAVAGETLGDLALDLDIVGLDAASLQRISDLLADNDSLTSLTPEQEAAFRADMRTILNRGFSIAVPRLTATVGDGTLTGKATVDLAEAGTATGPVSLYDHLTSSGELSAKGKALDDQQKMLAMASGFVRVVDDTLKADYSFSKGALTVSGKPVDPDSSAESLMMADMAINAFLDTPLDLQSLEDDGEVDLGGATEDDPSMTEEENAPPQQ